MANNEHLKIARQGSSSWNAFRQHFRGEIDLSNSDLSEVDLSNTDLKRINLVGAVLEGANLTSADLSSSSLQGAFLVEANLSKAKMRGANMSGADLAAANLSGADFFGAGLDAVEFIGADMTGCNLQETDLALARFRFTILDHANLTNAVLDGTLFSDVNLSKTIGLDTCQHLGESIVDMSTVRQSDSLPPHFLRGVGFSETLIEQLPVLMNKDREYHSCFISFSFKDKKFADLLYNDLRTNGVECWYAPHDMRIGPKMLDQITRAIKRHQKVLLILSKHSILSEWVEDEVTLAFETERTSGETILFPIRIDDSVLKSNEPWAGKIRQRHIGDFRKWNNGVAYGVSLERLKRDLARATKS